MPQPLPSSPPVFVLAYAFIDDDPQAEHEREYPALALAQAYVQRHLGVLRRWEVTDEEGQVVLSQDHWDHWTPNLPLPVMP
jgi:hypothetical protein